jgi:hypothetical protein
MYWASEVLIRGEGIQSCPLATLMTMALGLDVNNSDINYLY